MSTPAGDDDLWNEAMALLLAWQADPENEARRLSIREFCARDAAHHAAWEEAKRVYRLSGEAVDTARRQKRLTRRAVVGGGLGVLAAGTAYLAGPALWRQWRADIATQVAETRRERLADGSWLTLGPETAIRIAFAGPRRQIELLDGMALCEVARDGNRPFVVEAGGMSVRAAGSSFEVQKNGQRSLAGVEDGHVEVAIAGAGGAHAGLRSGEWLSLDASEGSIDRGSRDAEQTAAWRRGVLVAENERVSSVVEEIGRWRRGRIVVAQAGLASARVSGLYDLSDPDAALSAVVAPYGGKLRHLSPWLVVITTI